MELKTVTRYREDGSVQFKQSASVFQVEDMGNGIARGQLSVGKLPYDKSKKDQDLINAGYKLDQKGYIRGSFFVSFRGNAYEKALNLKNGAIIEDVVFDIDPYPYVGKDGKVEYRQSPQWIVIDFVEKQFGDGVGTVSASVQAEPYPRSPMYTQNNQKPVVQEEEYRTPEY